MCASINVENNRQAHKKPPLSRRRIACEILAGLAVAVPVLFVSAYVFAILAIPLEIELLLIVPPSKVGHDWGPVVMLFLFAFFAFPLLYGPASAIGVYLVGSRGKQTGSFSFTLFAGFLGTLVTPITLFGTRALSSVVLSVLGVTLNVRSERVVGWACWALVFLTAPIIATIAFNQTRRYQEPPSS